MTTETPEKIEEAYRINNPERPSLRFFPLQHADWWFVIFMVGIAAWANHFFGRAGLTTALILTVFLLFPNYDDRYWRVFVSKSVDLWIRKYHHGKLWRPGILSGPAWQFWRKPPELQLPKVWYFSTGVKEIPEMCITQNPADGSFSFVVVGDGSPLASYDLHGQHAGHGRFAELVSRAAATVQGMPFSASYHFRRRPLNTLEIAGHYHETLHPEVLYPGSINPPAELQHIPWEQWADQDEAELGPLTQWSPELREAIRCARLHRVMVDELLTTYSQPDVGAEPTMAMVCTVKPTGVIHDAARGRRVQRSMIRRHLLIQLAETILDGLQTCEVRNPRLMTVDEMHDYIRGGWDVASIAEYQLEVATAHGSMDKPLPERDLHWPQKEITVYNKYLSTDGTLHTVLRLTSLPSYLPPFYLRKIFAAPVPWLTVSVPVDTASSMREVTMLDRGINVLDAFKDGSRRVRQTRKQRKRRESLEDREERIYEARFKSDFTILIATSGLTLEDLEINVEKVKRHLKQMGIGCKEVKGESRQLPALLSATTGINMM